MHQVIIFVDIKEKITGDTIGKDSDWAPSEDELGQIDTASLSKHILQWHKDKDFPLLGSFEASSRLYFQNQQPRQVSKGEFSMEQPESSCLSCNETGYITAKELIPELDESYHILLPLQKSSAKMRDFLIPHEHV